MSITPGKISVLIIDDSPLTRFGLKTAIEAEQDTFEITEAENSEQGLKLIEKTAPDTVVINLVEPCFKGIETVKKIKSVNKKIKIIILSSGKNEEEVLEALKAGAQAYCLKGMTPKKILQVIKFINDGALWFDPIVAEGIKNILLRNKSKKLRPTEVIPEKGNNGKTQLTDRELDVLKLIVDGFSNAEISEKLCVSIHTSKAHVCNILHKLSVEDRTQAAIKALRDGII